MTETRMAYNMSTQGNHGKHPASRAAEGMVGRTVRKFFDSRSHQKKGLAKDPMLRQQQLPKPSVSSKDTRNKTDPEIRIGKANPAQNKELTFPCYFHIPSQALNSRHVLLRLHAWIASVTS